MECLGLSRSRGRYPWEETALEPSNKHEICQGTKFLIESL